jgi:hypothetical protein
MDTMYHKKLVLNETTDYQRTAYDSQLVEEAKTMFADVEQALIQVVSSGDYTEYVKQIRNYDKFVWEKSHEGDKTNIYAYKKIKVSPSWTEQFWAPIFERVRLKISELWNFDNLVLIQNSKVVESMGDRGPDAFKDVDAGIGIIKQINFDSVIMPVVVCESKTGHYCKTACTGVDAIIRRVRSMNSYVLGFAVTDNQVSVGKDQPVSNVFGAGGVLISQRGINNTRSDYPELDPNKFKLVEDLCINYLENMKPENFSEVKLKINKSQKLRECIDNQGYFIPEELEKYLHKGPQDARRL